MIIWLLKSVPVMFLITSMALASGLTLSMVARLMGPDTGGNALLDRD